MLLKHIKHLENSDFHMTYHAGFTTLQANDPDGRIACALWYPCNSPAQSHPQGVYDFFVTKNGPVANGPFGVIVMSHGSGGTRFGHCKTAEFMAQNGYIVLAPEHPQNNFFDDSAAGSARSYSHRSRHLKSALDTLLAHKTWGSVINLDKIAVFGFSLGGFSALTCVGAIPYVKGLTRHIRINREFDPVFSSYEVIVRDDFNDDYLPVTFDPRYKACIALAPVSGGLFCPDSLQNVQVPVQIFRAQHDLILRHPFHATEISENLPNGCDYHVTLKAGHFSYLSPVREDVKSQLGELANDNPGFDRLREHDKIHILIRDFLHKALS